MSFTFQPGNGRNNGCRHTDQDRNVEPGNIPRISRLTALAIRFEGLVQWGEVRDYADLAHLGCSRSWSYTVIQVRPITSNVSPVITDTCFFINANPKKLWMRFYNLYKVELPISG